MKIFIGIESCHEHRFMHERIRATWLEGCMTERKFFLTRPCSDLADDELELDALDGLWGLLGKVRREVEHVLLGDYDYFFRCHVDTYVHVPRLLKAVPLGLDYVGWPTDNPYEGREMCFGGGGFWLSRPAMLCLRRVLAEPFWVKEAEHAIDDWHVGMVLKDNGFKRWGDTRYRDRFQPPGPDNDFVTCHESAHDVKNPRNLRQQKWLDEAHATASKIKED